MQCRVYMHKPVYIKCPHKSSQSRDLFSGGWNFNSISPRKTRPLFRRAGRATRANTARSSWTGGRPEEEAKGKIETDARRRAVVSEKSTTSVAAGCTCITCGRTASRTLPPSRFCGGISASARAIGRSTRFSILASWKKPAAHLRRRIRYGTPTGNNSGESAPGIARCSVKFSNLQAARFLFRLFGIRERRERERDREREKADAVVRGKELLGYAPQVVRFPDEYARDKSVRLEFRHR